MKNFKILVQLFILVGGLIVVFVVVMYFEVRLVMVMIYNEWNQMFWIEIEIVFLVMKDFDECFKVGEFLVEEVMKCVFVLLMKMCYELDGYFFGYDYDVNLFFYFNLKIVGQNFKGKVDQNGFVYCDEIVKVGREGGGYVIFIGFKLGKDFNDYSYLKFVYVKVFELWKIVIVIGFYVDDLKSQICQQIIEIVVVLVVIFVLVLIVVYVLICGIICLFNVICEMLYCVVEGDIDMLVLYCDMLNEVGMMVKVMVELQDKVCECCVMVECEVDYKCQIDVECQQNVDFQVVEV